MRARHLVPLLVAAALAVPLAPSRLARRLHRSPLKSLTVEVLSNRADLVSGGDALVAVDLPAKVNPAKVQVLRRGPRRHRAVRRASRRPVRGPGHRAGPRRERRHREGAGVRRPAGDHQPPQRRPGLLGTAARPLPVPGDGSGRPVQRARLLLAALQVERPDPVRPVALRPGEPAVGRRRDDHRRGRHRAVHRAARGRLPGPRPLLDPHAVPARPGLGSRGRRRTSGTTRSSPPTAAAAARRTPRAARGSTTTPAPSPPSPASRTAT